MEISYSYDNMTDKQLFDMCHMSWLHELMHHDLRKAHGELTKDDPPLSIIWEYCFKPWLDRKKH